MARLFWLLLVAAFVALLVSGASWALAYNSIGTLLGSPPPRWGTSPPACNGMASAACGSTRRCGALPFHPPGFRERPRCGST